LKKHQRQGMPVEPDEDDRSFASPSIVVIFFPKRLMLW
jgi:hypothetical protein